MHCECGCISRLGIDDLDALKFKRVLFGGFPCYADSPLKPGRVDWQAVECRHIGPHTAAGRSGLWFTLSGATCLSRPGAVCTDVQSGAVRQVSLLC
jgi:hypothetical protein